LCFWASAEVFQPADAALDKARRCVEPYLNAAFATSSLATLEGKLRYVPIAMPAGEVFVDGAFEDQLREYLRGMGSSAPHLAGLGASPQQIREFEMILADAVERILVEQPDQTRH
jgi:hypothetical protein